ncbi:hypothetical protein ACK0NQ_04350 [Pseudomonas aeruginosa]|uniref:hypothetical protein n=1 Tax=Pseudomonas aeruginosa TaxID=287 RepID=UPI0039084259
MSLGEYLLYQTEDTHPLIWVRLQDGGLWLAQQPLADLRQSSPQNITLHIHCTYESGELAESAVCKSYLQVHAKHERQPLNQIANSRKRPAHSKKGKEV